MISGAIFNVGMEHLAHEIKTVGVQDANVVKKAFVDGRDVHGKSISKRIKGEVNQHNKDWKRKFNKAGKSVKHFFGF